MSGIPWSLGKNMYSLAGWQVVAGGCWLSPDEHKQCPPHTNFLVITCQVKSSRYLGIYLNYPLSWNDHTGNLSSPLQQRLYIFFFYAGWKSRRTHDNSWSMSCGYGSLCVRAKSKPLHLVQSISEQSVLRQTQRFLSDMLHILHPK